jgi:hypothetical protein
MMSRKAAFLLLIVFAAHAARAGYTDYDLYLYDAGTALVSSSESPYDFDQVAGVYEHYWTLEVVMDYDVLLEPKPANHIFVRTTLEVVMDYDVLLEGYALAVYIDDVLVAYDEGYYGGSYAYEIAMFGGETLKADVVPAGSAEYGLRLYDADSVLLDSSEMPGIDLVSASFSGRPETWTVSVTEVEDPDLLGYDVEIYVDGVLSFAESGTGPMDYDVALDPWQEVYVSLYSVGGRVPEDSSVTTCGSPVAAGEARAAAALWLVLPLAAGVLIARRRRSVLTR